MIPNSCDHPHLKPLVNEISQQVMNGKQFLINVGSKVAPKSVIMGQLDSINEF